MRDPKDAPRSSIRRSIGLAVLCLYAATMASSAMPDLLLPSSLLGARDGAFSFLESIRMRPGQAVFLGEHEGDLKIRAWCPIVLGWQVGGSPAVLYRPTEECFPRSFVWRRDRYYQTFQELLNVASKTWTSRGGERVNAAYGMIADYFCHSPLAFVPRVDRISIVEHRVFKNYSSGETTGTLLHAYSWSCSENAPVPRPWPSISSAVALGPTVP